ncbi:CoA-binding protein [Zoogloeaceae bacterium G21618-S1]|nr:CoA-binding protein [Zoogloeaceae bacterium G21618-S1]
MHQQGVGDFQYYVGISSLSQIATAQDKVCVLNILGGESSEVTPVGHAWSGGNVVFGTSPGRRGQTLDTPCGPIPVFNSVREGLEAGHRFNCGVVYLPPTAARDGVAELIRVNPELKKIFIITEKIAVHDAREIRAMGQQAGIDIFGANCLGVADAWNQVRIGGALGGDSPGDTLKRGSIAILSNSGGFTTTIAQYLRMAGWGTTTLVSSGKDIYIHYAAPEFAFALANDARSKAAVLYCEPGGYYERDADFTKPVVACVVGRWKAKLTRAVGHAGAMAGGHDDALSKERWFMEKFDVDALYTPENPVFSAKGAVVTNIAHIPAALTAVMRANATLPDFAPEGTMELKPWFGANQGIKLPTALDLPVVEAVAPHNLHIAELARSVGTVFARQNMKDASGASQMDPRTQLSSLHGVSMLDAAQKPLEANLALALLHEAGGPNDHALINLSVMALTGLHGTAMLAAAQAAREAGNAPNSVLAAAVSIVGPRTAEPAQRAAALLIDLFSTAGLEDACDQDADCSGITLTPAARTLLFATEPDPLAGAMIDAAHTRGIRSVPLTWLIAQAGHPSADAVLAALTTTLGWGPLRRKRVSRLSVEALPWWMRLVGTQLGASVDATQHTADSFCGIAHAELLGARSITDVAALALTGRQLGSKDLFAFQTLTGLLLTNGPGAISAQGAKGAVSADGPETPSRVQLNKAVVGFLTHTGFAHGGNGFEGVAFLLERFAGQDLTDPGNPDHGLDLPAMINTFINDYAAERSAGKETGAGSRNLPCINHPVFKGKPVNVDPREKFVRELFAARGEYNIFHDYYRQLVQALFDRGVTRNVFCVNVDALIATLLLKMMWQPLQAGRLSTAQMETAAFTAFLYGRMIGCAGEIDDHLNRGRNMDTRTPQSQVRFVA